MSGGATTAAVGGATATQSSQQDPGGNHEQRVTLTAGHDHDWPRFKSSVTPPGKDVEEEDRGGSVIAEARAPSALQALMRPGLKSCTSSPNLEATSGVTQDICLNSSIGPGDYLNHQLDFPV